MLSQNRVSRRPKIKLKSNASEGPKICKKGPSHIKLKSNASEGLENPQRSVSNQVKIKWFEAEWMQTQIEVASNQTKTKSDFWELSEVHLK